MIATTDAVVFDTRNGLHKVRERPPWEIIPTFKTSQKVVKQGKWSEDTDLKEKEFQSQNQAGDMNDPVIVVTEGVAPMEILSGGTYQGGTEMVNKNDELRTATGLKAIPDNLRHCDYSKPSNFLLQRNVN